MGKRGKAKTGPKHFKGENYGYEIVYSRFLTQQLLKDYLWT